MRKWTGLSVGVLVLVATMASAAAAQTAPAAVTPLSVDEIIAKHILTKGGAEKWKTIESQRMTGVASAQGFELAMTVYGKRPNLSRQELKLEATGQPAVTIVTLFDGTKAWTINPTSGSDAPQEEPQLETATAKVQSDFDGPLLDYKAKGFTVELLAPATVGGKRAHHLRVARADAPTQHYYLDPDSFVELKITVEGPNASDTELSDYRVVEGHGIMVPYAIKIMQNGVLQAALRILTVEFNVPLEDALFRVK